MSCCAFPGFEDCLYTSPGHPVTVSSMASYTTVFTSTLLLIQIEEEAVLLLAGLLKLSEAPARAQLQRVLLNLCAHSQTRKQVMQTLMSMLRAPLSADEAAEASQVCNLCVLP